MTPTPNDDDDSKVAAPAPPRGPEELFRRYDFRARKRFGQHFLVNSAILDELVTLADIRSQDRVLEVGPGCGTLTLVLLQRGAEINAIEIDRDAVAFLKEQLVPHFPLQLHSGSALDIDLGEILKSTALPWKVVANLPYNVGTKILFRLFECREHIEEMTLMFQREVADRLVATVGDSEYGALSLMAQLHSDVHLAMTLPSHAFIPAPKVTSAVVQFRLLPTTRIQDGDVRRVFRRIVKAAFQARRKTLANGMKMAGYDKGLVEDALVSLDLGKKVRPQRVGFEEFRDLAEILLDAG